MYFGDDIYTLHIWSDWWGLRQNLASSFESVGIGSMAAKVLSWEGGGTFFAFSTNIC